jgi:hypothetical protein
MFGPDDALLEAGADLSLEYLFSTSQTKERSTTRMRESTLKVETVGETPQSRKLHVYVMPHRLMN